MPELPVLDARSEAHLDRADIARRLAAAIEGEVRFGLHDRMLYATDASLYQIEPLGVVIPSSIDDAVRAVRFCAQHALPILPRGGGTSLAGQCTNRAVVIDFSPACNALVELDEHACTTRVEPGLTIDDLNDAIRSTGLFFAPDPATSRHANIGGCIGNNAAGARSIRYGRTSENVLAVDAVLATGERVTFDEGAAERDPIVRRISERVASIVREHSGLIRERFPKTIRRNAGYNLDLVLAQLDACTPGTLDRLNLAHLLCGSEGTLAVTLGATLRLHPIPKARGLAVVAFPTLDAAIDAVMPILATQPTAVELLDDIVVNLARANAEYRRYVDLLPTPPGESVRAVLYVEYASDAGEHELLERFADLRRTFGDARVQSHTSASAMAQAWKLRKAGEPLLHGVPGDRKPHTFVEDNAVPPAHLAEFVRRFREIVRRHGTTAAFYAHASVGVLHVRPLVNIADEGDRAIMRSIALEVADLARELGGVMSGEHGDGRVRTPLLERFYGPELMRAFTGVKRAFDPANLLNPGDIVSLDGQPRTIESMTETLRVKPGSRDVAFPAVRTYFDYDDQHGFRGAVEMCNGSGVCRKKQGGTMCPSYMATLDERHSTRGRGNALRLAITGQLAQGPTSRSTETPQWHDEDTHSTLHLCLSCKACKTECPSNVDVARLKAEFLAQHYKDRGRTPLAARLMGHVHILNALAGLTPRLATFMNDLPPTRMLLERFARIDRRRSLPHFEKPLTRAFSRDARHVPQHAAHRPIVVLFGDCFTTFNEPRIGLAAKRVFEALGYEVRLARPGCCGRALISTGLLEDARRVVESSARSLLDWARAPGVRAILFLEPSCLSAIKDDWQSLRTSIPRERMREIADHCFLAEDFLDRAWSMHPRSAAIERTLQPRGEATLHAHCHQKALWGAETSARALQRVCEHVTTLDSGCCGMAGSFGYTTDRFDLSNRIGELTLFPAVRAAPASAEIAAPGTSCRHQVRDATGVRAMHPIEIIADRIAGPASRTPSPRE
ncbi:MAG: FAD-linked oxidase C-terminal domain-containing protein [Phycisphaerales bacterium]|jgi:FAD/FMN-containing dehydrogenase/Fe-S oxidoreductase|nr:FAD-linked oxidase C-terminal domain-containing protein [Phycisphaerales bacterium]